MVDGVEVQLTTGYQSAMVPKPANLFQVCPAARLPFAHITYGWSVDRQQYVLVDTASGALVRDQPPLALPMKGMMGRCGGADALVVPGRSVPPSIPRSVQDSAKQRDALRDYLAKDGQVILFQAEMIPYADVMSRSFCGPA
ncbi:hypothetical protein ACFO1B_21065 [Dactylosporangium siamense]|uniref:Uncharacterized protein n=1 Tax=Dactylosporangium siamense TaxID=685454 RepID=A0A919PQR4_9ACTN|nr:hypothetical protein [Dactylosporangium siamense]GIG46775.1 hypothetical protein Dsi01nite_048160 [Dactylosporangium siamense]